MLKNLAEQLKIHPDKRARKLGFFLKYGSLKFDLNTRTHWNEKLSRYPGFWRDENYHHILDLLPREEAFSLLDVGCAVGDGCELLQREFPKARIEGSDFSEVGIRTAIRKTRKVRYRILDIVKSEIPKTYDYITLIETLEHFRAPFRIIDKCLRRVRKALIISVPYSPGKSGCLDEPFSEHKYSFDETTLNRYACDPPKITEYVQTTCSRCIIYKVYPPTPRRSFF